MELEEKMTKAIKFFRDFKNNSSTELYQIGVLRFCDIVEQYIKEKMIQETIK